MVASLQERFAEVPCASIRQAGASNRSRASGIRIEAAIEESAKRRAIS
jgi:hypothetical protein